MGIDLFDDHRRHGLGAGQAGGLARRHLARLGKLRHGRPDDGNDHGAAQHTQRQEGQAGADWVLEGLDPCIGPWA
ncbi:hypothetical protein [Delftia sp.]|uniref:hypothetical protein n=1 Tax=Delftia sp. TaxID=1886637 RepID=UPI00259CEEE1|nr:hypothetical protein [Delftia sp.]